MQNSPDTQPVLRLFIAGNSPRSQQAIQTLRLLIQEFLGSIGNFEIIDIYQQPEIARREQVVATPTLIKYQPAPKRIMIGDLSKTERVIASLGWVKP